MVKSSLVTPGKDSVHRFALFLVFSKKGQERRENVLFELLLVGEVRKT